MVIVIKLGFGESLVRSQEVEKSFSRTKDED